MAFGSVRDEVDRPVDRDREVDDRFDVVVRFGVSACGGSGSAGMGSRATGAGAVGATGALARTTDGRRALGAWGLAIGVAIGPAIGVTIGVAIGDGLGR